MKKWTLLIMCLAFLSTGCAAKKYTVEEGLEDSKISGKVQLEFKEMALAIGKITGEGTLTYDGQQYPFRMSGFDYGSISKVTMQTYGVVYHLDDLSEFEGIYFQARAGFTLKKTGKTGIFLVNKRGVTIHLTSDKESGFDLTLGRGGIKIKFTE